MGPSRESAGGQQLDAVKAAIRQIDEFADFPFSIGAKPTNGGPKN
jgi:hypothetical protein